MSVVFTSTVAASFAFRAAASGEPPSWLTCPVGAVLRPGAAALLLGAPADEFAEFAGVTPTACKMHLPREANHLPIGTENRLRGRICSIHGR